MTAEERETDEPLIGVYMEKESISGSQIESRETLLKARTYIEVHCEETEEAVKS